MKNKIDQSYRFEELSEWESNSLKEKYSSFSLSKKSTWEALGFIIVLSSIISLVIPFLPPRFVWGSWSPPTTMDEYKYRVFEFLIVFPILIILVFFYVNLRNRIDIQLGFKRIANFRITTLIDLGIFKILILNKWRLFSLRKKHRYYISANKGCIITIKRTGTFRIFDYYIRDEKKFIEES